LDGTGVVRVRQIRGVFEILLWSFEGIHSKEERFFDMKIFGGAEADLGLKQRDCKVYLQPISYNQGFTWGAGADYGFGYMMDAAKNMELYDIETGQEVYKAGIWVESELADNRFSMSDMKDLIYERAKNILVLTPNMFPTFFGGNHSISIGIIEAMQEQYGRDLTILHLDAHLDRREEYDGSKYNHACSMFKANKHGHVVSVGIRSMSEPERYYRKDDVFTADGIVCGVHGIEDILNRLKKNVYISIDFDVFDPSIFPATGTPEPGGLSWYWVLNLMRNVFRFKEVVGFDMVEFSPLKELRYPDMLAAQLYYKLINYKFENGK
jgi:agmatinase